jgi:hypothetical protein
MKTNTLFFISFFFLQVAYSQNYPCNALITLNSNNYEIKECLEDTLLIWRNKFSDTIVARIRIIGHDTIETTKRYRRFVVKNGRLYFEQLPVQYKYVVVQDTIKVHSYRIKIVGKDTIKEVAPGQYSTKTENVVVQEDISPGTPMSLLTLDLRKRITPDVYKVNYTRGAADAGFESSNVRIEPTKPYQNSGTKPTMRQKPNQSTPNKKNVKKKPSTGTKNN